LIDAIADLPGIDRIVLTAGSGVRAEPPYYFLGMQQYDNLRRALDRIGRHNQTEAHQDKRLLAYTNLQHAVDANTFPLKKRVLKPGAIYELVKIGGERAIYSREDQKAAVDLVKSHKASLAKSDGESLLSLRADLEKVALDVLIQRFEAMLTKALGESQWQAFFNQNPFILSLAFALPVYLLQDHAYVGGTTLRGFGEKITDFLLAQRYTGNLALVEIKTPATKLLSSTMYRPGVFTPSKDLVGAVSQVLDQKFKLQTNFTQKAYESGLSDVHPYAIQCIVITGTSPAHRDEKKSLELYRHAGKDVVVVTFDELINKLKEIQRVFNAGAEADSQDQF